MFRNKAVALVLLFSFTTFSFAPLAQAATYKLSNGEALDITPVELPRAPGKWSILEWGWDVPAGSLGGGNIWVSRQFVERGAYAMDPNEPERLCYDNNLSSINWAKYPTIDLFSVPDTPLINRFTNVPYYGITSGVGYVIPYADLIAADPDLGTCSPFPGRAPMEWTWDSVPAGYLGSGDAWISQEFVQKGFSAPNGEYNFDPTLLNVDWSKYPIVDFGYNPFPQYGGITSGVGYKIPQADLTAINPDFGILRTYDPNKNGFNRPSPLGGIQGIAQVDGRNVYLIDGSGAHLAYADGSGVHEKTITITRSGGGGGFFGGGFFSTLMTVASIGLIAMGVPAWGLTEMVATAVAVETAAVTAAVATVQTAMTVVGVVQSVITGNVGIGTALSVAGFTGIPQDLLQAVSYVNQAVDIAKNGVSPTTVFAAIAKVAKVTGNPTLEDVIYPDALIDYGDLSLPEEAADTGYLISQEQADGNVEVTPLADAGDIFGITLDSEDSGQTVADAGQRVTTDIYGQELPEDALAEAEDLYTTGSVGKDGVRELTGDEFAKMKAACGDPTTADGVCALTSRETAKTTEPNTGDTKQTNEGLSIELSKQTYEQGVETLRKDALSSTNERMEVFVMRNDGTSEWHKLSTSDFTAAENHVRFSYSAFDALVNDPDVARVDIVHTHPLRMIVSNPDMVSQIEGGQARALSMPPSTTDILDLAFNREQSFKENAYKLGTTVVIDPAGVWEAQIADNPQSILAIKRLLEESTALFDSLAEREDAVKILKESESAGVHPGLRFGILQVAKERLSPSTSKIIGDIERNFQGISKDEAWTKFQSAVELSVGGFDVLGDEKKLEELKSIYKGIGVNLSFTPHAPPASDSSGESTTGIIRQVTDAIINSVTETINGAVGFFKGQGEQTGSDEGLDSASDNAPSDGSNFVLPGVDSMTAYLNGIDYNDPKAVDAARMQVMRIASLNVLNRGGTEAEVVDEVLRAGYRFDSFINKQQLNNSDESQVSDTSTESTGGIIGAVKNLIDTGAQAVTGFIDSITGQSKETNTTGTQGQTSSDAGVSTDKIVLASNDTGTQTDVGGLGSLMNNSSNDSNAPCTRQEDCPGWVPTGKMILTIDENGNTIATPEYGAPVQEGLPRVMNKPSSLIPDSIQKAIGDFFCGIFGCGSVDSGQPTTENAQSLGSGLLSGVNPFAEGKAVGNNSKATPADSLRGKVSEFFSSLLGTKVEIESIKANPLKKTFDFKLKIPF